jgi:hypothetical protein
VPSPGPFSPNNPRIDQSHIVYRVFPADNSDTFKFGISSDYSLFNEFGWVSGRPQSALNACDAYYRAAGNPVGCVWTVQAEVGSLPAARAVEEALIAQYQSNNGGFCPPGQERSCK